MRRQNKQVSESEACRSSSSVFFYPKSNKNQSRVLSKEKTSALSFTKHALTFYCNSQGLGAQSRCITVQLKDNVGLNLILSRGNRG